MAQTKSKGKAKSSGSRSSSTRKTSTKSGSSRSRPTKARSSPGTRKASSGNKSGGAARKSSSTSSDQATVSRLAEKAKGPALAGGAVLAGLAGGYALTNGNGRMPKLSKPSVDLPLLKPKKTTALKLLGGAAKTIAKGSYKVGQVTAEVWRIRHGLDTSD